MTTPHRPRPRAPLVAAALALLLGPVLGGCASGPHVVEGSAIVVEVPGPVTSLNPSTGHGGTPGNLALAAATGTGFVLTDDRGALTRDESFGRMEITDDDPFTVRYTIDERATWSDGVPITATDLLLAWAANSGALNTPGLARADAIDLETGAPAGNAPPDAVFFDGAVNSGLQHVTRTPELDPADPRTITLVWDRPFADWELTLAPGVPAHVLGRVAFDGDAGTAPEAGADADAAVAEARDAAAAVAEAIIGRDAPALAALANSWNTGFDLGGSAVRGTPVVAGPYRVQTLADGGAVLVANEAYEGDRRPRIERVELRPATDPLTSVNRLIAGEVDVITLSPSVEAMATLDAAADEGRITLVQAVDGLFEHLDLRFSQSRSGAIEHPLVRQAFLAALPREALAEAVQSPIGAEGRTRDSFVIAPYAEGYHDVVAANGSEAYRERDLERARSLLAQAGTVAPPVCVLFDPANPRRVEEFEAIRSAATEAGFVVSDCSRADWVDVLGDPGAWDAALFAWRATNPGVTGVAARLRAGAPGNFSRYANPDVDALLHRLERATDSAAHPQLLREIDARLWADGYGVPLYQEPIVLAHAASVSGISVSPFPSGTVWNLWQWSPSTSR